MARFPITSACSLEAMPDRETLLLIDGHAAAYRAFYAILSPLDYFLSIFMKSPCNCRRHACCPVAPCVE